MTPTVTGVNVIANGTATKPRDREDTGTTKHSGYLGSRNNGNGSFSARSMQKEPGLKKVASFNISCILNEWAQERDLDMNSSVSILTEDMVRNIRCAKVSKMFQKVKDYGDNVVQFIGEIILNVKI